MRNAFADRAQDEPSTFDGRLAAAYHNRQCRSFGANLTTGNRRIYPRRSLRKALRSRYTRGSKINDQSTKIKPRMKSIGTKYEPLNHVGRRQVYADHTWANRTRQLVQWGTEVDLKRLEEAYFQTRVITKKQYESILRLLTIFAQHLSGLSNELMVKAAVAESPQMTKARVFIADHQAEELSLGQVASAVNISSFYFCKTFKKATGMTFTNYLARVRIEKVKNLLLNPHKRVSEVAFEAGFQSLSQFNRVFRRIAGESPTVYRERLHGAGNN